MRFRTGFGAFVQTWNNRLVDYALLRVITEGHVPVGLEPTARLESMFSRPFELAEVYELLVEATLLRMNELYPGFVDVGQLERKLRDVGLTEEGWKDLMRLYAK